ATGHTYRMVAGVRFRPDIRDYHCECGIDTYRRVKSQEAERNAWTGKPI
ncbi:unnamed protein product, partial [marine sediment metagenome]